MHCTALVRLASLIAASARVQSYSGPGGNRPVFNYGSFIQTNWRDPLKG